MRNKVTEYEGIEIFVDDIDGKFYASPTLGGEIKDSTLDGIKKKLMQFQKPIHAIEISGYGFPNPHSVNVIQDKTSHRIRYAPSGKMAEKYASIYYYDEYTYNELLKLLEEYSELKRKAQLLIDRLGRISSR